MKLYFDSAYVGKCYLHEPDGVEVRKVAGRASGLYSSALAVVELASLLLRHRREKRMTGEQGAIVRELFQQDVRDGSWILLPVSSRILYRAESVAIGLPATVFLRAGDAIHLASAAEAKFDEIWTSDRHMLAAAPHFGLIGRSV
ncbi:MAG: type II toxin-antitoxin system VapC family toxin [Bryobacteraceae bacterium]